MPTETKMMMILIFVTSAGVVRYEERKSRRSDLKQFSDDGEVYDG